MNVTNTSVIKARIFMGLAILTMVLSGCSSDYLRDDYRRPSAKVGTKIPEIKQLKRQVKAPIKRMVRPYKPQVKRYAVTHSTSVKTAPKSLLIDAELLKAKRKKQAMVDIDPYASIPDDRLQKRYERSTGVGVEVKPQKYKSSSAVKSLMMRARADIAIGNSQSAISKLERGLRIESQNPNIWYLLAKAQYNQANHQQAISMAKKSIRYANDDKLVSQNWTLIQKAGEKSNDTVAIKEALAYFKVNP